MKEVALAVGENDSNADLGARNYDLHPMRCGVGLPPLAWLRLFLLFYARLFSDAICLT